MRGQKSGGTREQLLAAAEAWVSEDGFDAVTHRGLGERAKLHPALVTYYFGGMAELLDEVVARGMPALVTQWNHALAHLHASPPLTPYSVLHAYGTPLFPSADTPAPQRRFVGVVAHLLHDPKRVERYQHYFHAIEADFLSALRQSMPALAEGDLGFAFDCARHFVHGVAYRARHDPATMARSPASGAWDPRVFRLLAKGIEGLAAT